MSDKDLVSWDRVIDEKIANAVLSLNTIQPGKVVSYDAATNTARVQPSISVTTVDDDGTAVPVEQPTLVDIPVLQPTVGQYSITLPITPETEGLILHCQRDIDNVVLGARPGRPATTRVQHISDGLFVPLPISDASRAKVVSPEGLQLRAGAVTLTVNETGVAIVGNVTVTGTVTALDHIAGIIHLLTHIHTAPGGGGPTTPPIA